MLPAALSVPYPPPTAGQIRTTLYYLPQICNVDDIHHVAALIPSHPSSPSLLDHILRKVGTSRSEEFSRTEVANCHGLNEWSHFCWEL